ncbi:prolyl-tRNA synthetase [Halovenus aranensis]|uniref:proline--tRNA ligase n=1 Tax=Halovenus aranensis TaxID=890420 RepID=A0A1G8V0H9_9EURY|nr:aminoacyl--tRNA ligase-related protein [Halovenus aranensis]SDJ58845.1 prolyl-tRNA synthetase [Halovenus aranensis]
MRRSDAFLCTSREETDHESETVRLVHRAGLARQLGSGLYALAPVGQRVRAKVIDHIEAEMDAIGGQQVSLPSLNGDDIWRQSGRWESFEGEMFTVENREGRQLCLAPSHEEGIVSLVDGAVRSYDDLPLLLYQVTRKYRDDHPRNGLVRTKEFTMKDAYSLHASRESLEEHYERIRAAYVRIFENLGLEFAITAAENEVMGGSASAEFQALVETGSETLHHCTGTGCRFGVTDDTSGGLSAGDSCPECGGELTASAAIELGHVFKLGTRYSEAMGLTVDGPDGTEQAVVMGSYGIGIERLIQAVVAQHADSDGCRWPDGIAPFSVAIVPLAYEGEVRAAADRLHEACGSDEALLFDDGSQHIGERFAESDLLGIPWKVVLGNHFRETGEVELETRDGETRYVALEEVTGIVS